MSDSKYISVKCRYFCDGPQGHFYCDDLELVREILDAYDFDSDWTITDLWNPTGK